MILQIDPDWTFKQAVANLKTLRTRYEGILASFDLFQEQHEKVIFMRRIRNSFYSLNIPEWQIDKLWRYINHDEFYYVLKGIANRQK